MMSSAAIARSAGAQRVDRDDDRLDRLFRALADRTRRALLQRLADDGAAMVTELAAPFEMSLPAVSKHLKVLERAGLVRRDVDGRVHTCSLSAEPLKSIESWLAFYRPFWDETLDALARYVERDSDGDEAAKRR